MQGDRASYGTLIRHRVDAHLGELTVSGIVGEFILRFEAAEGGRV